MKHKFTNKSQLQEKILLFLTGLASGVLGYIVFIYGVIALTIPVGLLFLGILYNNIFHGLLLFLFLVPSEVLLTTGAGSGVLRFLGLGIIGVWLAQLLTKKRQVRFSSMISPFILYIFWSGLTTFWAITPNISRNLFQTYLQIGLLLIIIIDQVNSQNRLRLTIHALLFGGILAIILGIAFGQFDPSRYAGNRLVLTSENIGITAYGYPLAYSVIILALTVFLQRKRWRWFIGVFFMAGLFLLILVGLRGAIITVIAGISITIFGKHWAWKLIQFLLISITIFITIELMRTTNYLPEELVQHLTIDNAIETGGSGRDDLLRLSLNVFRNNPIVGIGLGQFPKIAIVSYLADYKALGTHSDYTATLAELGIVGFAFWVIGDAICLYIIAKGRNLTSDISSYQFTILLALLIASMVSMLFVQLLLGKYIWIIRALVIANYENTVRVNVTQSSINSFNKFSISSLQPFPRRLVSKLS